MLIPCIKTVNILFVWLSDWFVPWWLNKNTVLVSTAIFLSLYWCLINFRLSLSIKNTLPVLQPFSQLPFYLESPDALVPFSSLERLHHIKWNLPPHKFYWLHLYLEAFSFQNGHCKKRFLKKLNLIRNFLAPHRVMVLDATDFGPLLVIYIVIIEVLWMYPLGSEQPKRTAKSFVLVNGAVLV